MSKPLIGLTTTRIPNKDGLPTFAANLPYARSVSMAGGIPVLIPMNLADEDVDQLVGRLDGILFTGGYDIDPQRYGNQPHPKVKQVDKERDQQECQLVQAAVKAGRPFLGICRGMQVINVAMGGSLYEDLADQLPDSLAHDNHDKPRNFLAHAVSIERDTLLDQIIPCNQTQVNSLHHQGLHQLASSLRPSAISPDGLVEAIEMPDIPFGLAVQWHPEELQEYASMRRLFQEFVRNCSENNH